MHDINALKEISILNVLSNTVQYNCSNGAQTLSTIHEQEIELAKCLLLFVTYYELDATRPLSTKDRNAIIRTRYGEGEPLTKLAEGFGISPQRIYQIVNFKNK